MDNAFAIPESLAAAAVRALAFVAALIPKYPANVEKRLPIKKQIAVTQLFSPIARPITKKTTITKITRTLYSANKKA